MPEASQQIVAPTSSTVVHEITYRSCLLLNGRLVPRGEPVTASLMEAVKTLAPTGTRSARLNVMRVRRLDYVGVRQQVLSNFVIRNQTIDGDIRWLLNQDPGFENSFKEIYLIDGVFRRGPATEVTFQNGL